MQLPQITLPSPGPEPTPLASLRGQRSVLVLANQQSRDTAVRIVADLQTRPETASVPVLQLAHLVGVPRPVRSIAERTIARDFARQLTDLRSKRGAQFTDDPPVRLGLDWNGAITSLFGFTSRNVQPVVVVLDGELVVDAVLPGDDSTPILSALAAAGPSPEAATGEMTALSHVGGAQ